LTDVPLVTVVLLENVMLELHDPSAGKFTAVPATMVLAVPVPLAETVPHGNVSAGLLEVVGVLVADAATTVGALVLEQPETIAAETMNASVAPTKSGRLSDVFMKLGASKLPQRERRHPQNGGYLTTGFIFSVVPAFLVKSSQKRHLSGRVLSQVADADPNQAHGGSLYVRALQALLGRGEDRRRLVGRLGEMRLAARDLEVGALESPHATPRPRFNGAATISSRNSTGTSLPRVRTAGFNGAATISSRNSGTPSTSSARSSGFNGAATISSRNSGPARHDISYIRLLQWGRDNLVAEFG
jgi:hypothetical protein